MRRRVLIFLIIGLTLLGGGVLGSRALSPRLVQVSPAPDARQVARFAPIRLEFNQVLTLDSLRERLKIEPEQPGRFHWEGKSLIFTPDQPWQYGATIQVTLERGARSASFPWLALQEGAAWQFHVSQRRLAYLWSDDGIASLYTLQPESGDIQRLTWDMNILDYHFSADGRWIYCSADDRQSGSQIVRIDLAQIPAHTEASYAIEPLIECPQAVCRLAQPSPDGRWLAYERIPLHSIGAPERSAVFLFSLELRESRQISAEGHFAAYPTWSPDGLLAFYDRELMGYQVVHPDLGTRLALPNQTGEPGLWQPDHNAFVALEVLIESSGLLSSGGVSHLMRYELSPDKDTLVAQKDLSQAFDLEDKDPAFSPDGTRLAFSRRYLDPGRWTPGRQLWVMTADGSQAQALTAEPAYHHYAFAWSPDNTQIAYVRFDPTLLTQPPELWIINADGTNPIQLVIGGFAPQWMP